MKPEIWQNIQEKPQCGTYITFFQNSARQNFITIDIEASLD